jgi:hypothetical protein
LEQVAEENAMLQVARAILADPEPMPEPVPETVEAVATAPVVEIVPPTQTELAVVPEVVMVEAAPAAAPTATPDHDAVARQLPLFGQLLAHVSKPKRRPQPVDHHAATQLSLFGHFTEAAVPAAA